MYTSGTESRPKGAILSSRSLMWQYVSCIVDGGMEGTDVEVHALPLYHTAQLDCFLGPDIYLGATSIILPAPDPATLLRTIETERVTKLFCPPTVWISLLRSPHFDSTDLSSLRKGYYGASPMPVEVLQGAAAAAAGRPALELLRADRDGTARDDPRPGRAGQPGRVGGTRRPQRRDPGGGRRRPAGPARHRGRDRAPQPARDPGLLQGRGEDRRGVPATAGSTPATSVS